MLTVPALVQHFIFFFFFQAEDGIRDGHVTGVQTCALPIYDTVLRRVKVPSSATLSSNPPDVLGVDDWAWRKGHTYGTILVDLEQHCVVDLLPCRSAESFEAWLRGICVLNRGWQCYQRVDYDRADCTPTSVPQRPFLVA